MRYLVTGGAGFIGSHLTEALLNRGDEVVVLDDCSTGSLDNLATFADNPGLKVLHGSVCDALLVDEAVGMTDSIIHLAASVGVRRILDRQVRSIVTNLRGTEVVLQHACAHGNKPVFLASTSEVYGKGVKAPFCEEDDSVLGATHLHRWSYACAKAMDEFLALAYHRERGMPLLIGRFFNTTGPRQSSAYGMVLPTFAKKILAGEKVLVHGDGEQSRCFCHVADTVRAILLLLDCPEAQGKVVNIGGQEEITMADLAKRVGELAGKPADIELISYEKAFPGGGFEDMRRRVPDTTRLSNLTGWNQEKRLDDIIRDTIESLTEQGA